MKLIRPPGEDDGEWPAEWIRLSEAFFPSLRQAIAGKTLDTEAVQRVLDAWQETPVSPGENWLPFAEAISRMRAMLWCADHIQKTAPLADSAPPAVSAELPADAPPEARDRADLSLACVRIFRGEASRKRIAVPIALAAELTRLKGGIATLVFDVYAPGNGRLSLSPEENFRISPDEDFTESLNAAWRIALEVANNEDGRSEFPDVLWRAIRESPSMSGLDEKVFIESAGLRLKGRITGRSASGAAARAFRHLLNGTHLDPDVFVLAQVREDATPAGQLEAVGGITAKVEAIADVGHFATVIVTEQDKAEADLAVSRKKANSRIEFEVDPRAMTRIKPMAATLAHLVTIRSQLAEEICLYCTRLIDTLDRTPWFRQGKNIRASDVAVPVRVLKESTGPEPSRSERERTEDDSPNRREREPSRDYVDPELAALYEEATREKRKEEVPWLQERAQVRRAIVLGGPGSGKTFLTQTTGLDLAAAALDAVRKQRTGLDCVAVPVHLTLASLARPDLPPDPAEAVLKLLREEWSPTPCFLSWLKERLRTASTWLLLDALDEVPETHRPALTDRLRAIDSQGWQTRRLLTCRPANWTRELIPWADLTEYELAPLNSVEIRQFVQRSFASDGARSNTLVQALNRNYPLAHAARTPLIATFLCLAHEETAVTTTTRRAELYAHVVRGLARRAWKEKPLAKTDPHVDDLVRFLVRIALPLFERHPAGNLFAHNEITTALEGNKGLPIPLSVLEAQRAGHPMPSLETWPTLLRDELLQAGILIGAGLRDGMETQFSFAHRSLLEYLVARNLNGEINAKGWKCLKGFVDKKSWHPAWQETVVFLAGLMDNPVPLLALLADAAKDDMTRQRLCLAGRCLSELSPEGRRVYQSALEWRKNIVQEPSERLSKPKVAHNVIRLWRTIAEPLLRFSRACQNALRCRNADEGQFSDELQTPDIASEVLQLWWNAEPRARFSHVTNTLPAIGAASASELVPELLRRSQEASAKTRGRALEALGYVGSAAATEPALSRLTDCLGNSNREVRLSVAEALGRMGAAGATEQVLSRLTESLRDHEPKARPIAAKDSAPCGVPRSVGGAVPRAAEQRPDLTIGCQPFRSSSTPPTNDQVQQLLDEFKDVNKKAEDNLRDLKRKIAETDMKYAQALVQYDISMMEAAKRILLEQLGLGRASDCDVRSSTAKALGELGAAAATEPVLSRLADCLRDPEKEVRSEAAEAFGRMGAAAATEPVLRRLTDCLRDPEKKVRSEAVEAFGRMGAAAAAGSVLSRLSDCLRDPEKEVRSKAAKAFGRMGAAAATEPVLRRLTDCLRDPEEEVRSKAAEACGRMGAAAATEPVLSRLTDWLRDPEEEVRSKAVEAFGRMGAAAATEPVLRRLTDWLRDPEEEVRSKAVEAFGRMGAAAATEPVLRRLTDWLHDPEGDVRSSAVEALGRLGAAAATEPVLSRLTDCLRDPERKVCCAAARALGELGAAAASKPALSRLTDWLRDPEADVRSSAAQALGRLGAVAATEPVLNCLTGRLRDPERKVRCAAARALGELGAAAASKPALSRLADCLRDPEMRVRLSAVLALRELGAAAATEPALSRLADCLRDPEMRVRLSAVLTLRELGAAAATEPVLSRLTDCLRGPSMIEPIFAAQALGRMGSAAATEAVLSRLTDCLGDPDREVRHRAAEAFVELGAVAATEPVLRRLTECLGDADDFVRKDATVALQRFLGGGVRWFAGRRGALVVRTVAELSGEAELLNG